MMKQEFKELMDRFNLNNKEVCCLAGMSEKHFSQIVNEKVLISAEDSITLSRIFELDELHFYKLARVHKINSKEVSKKDKEIIDYLERTNSYKLADPLSLHMMANKIFNGDSYKGYEAFLEYRAVEFRRFKDSPLAYFWAAVTEKHYCKLKSNGSFKRVDGIKVIPKVLDVMLTDEKIDIKIQKATKILDANGIVFRTTPYLSGSGAQAMALKRGKQHFIYVTDAGKREYKFIFNLIHELMHGYFGIQEESVDRLAFVTINKHIVDNKMETKISKEMKLAFESFNSNDESKWETLRDKTTLKVNFGNFEDMIEGAV